MPKVTVSIPCYNAASSAESRSWLEEAVDSVLTQSHDDLELLLIDDGSPDDTYEFLEQFTDDPRVSRHTQENQGFPGARNTGLDLGDGEYYAFIGQDDVWDENKLERQIEFLQSSDADLVHSNTRHIDETGETFGHRHETAPPEQEGAGDEQFIRELFLRNFICIQSVLAEAHVFEDVRFDESLSINCDHDLWLRLAGEFDIGYVPDTLLSKRFHGSNTSSRYEELHEQRIALIEKTVDQYPFLEDVRDQKLSKVYLTHGINLIQDGRLKEGRSALSTAIQYDTTCWKAYATYLLTLGGSRFGIPLVRRFSRAP